MRSAYDETKLLECERLKYRAEEAIRKFDKLELRTRSLRSSVSLMPSVKADIRDGRNSLRGSALEGYSF